MKFTINPNSKKRSNDAGSFGQSLNSQNAKQSKTEQQHLADVYATFVQSFDGPSIDTTRTSSTFVHGGSLDPNSNRQTPAPVPFLPPPSMPPVNTATALLGSRKLTARDLARLKKEQQKKSTAKSKKKGGQRQIQLLFEEMKARQHRDSEHAQRPSSSSDKHGRVGEHATANTAAAPTPLPVTLDNHVSTNLYVGNLPLDICEAQLHEIFGRFGIIASCKIMWPRTDEERARDRLCGFVSYIRRCDAELALNELKDNHLFGERLRLGWGKPVSKGSKKTTALNEEEIVLKEAAAAAAAAGNDGVAQNGSVGDVVNLMEYQVPPGVPRFVVKRPSNETVRRIIDRTAYFVALHGAAFERHLIHTLTHAQSGGDHALFAEFLTRTDSELHHYYRWRVYSISMGDSLYMWRRTPFQIAQNGPYWIPPVMQHTTDINLQIQDDIFFLRQRPKERNTHHHHQNKHKRGGKNKSRGAGEDGEDDVAAAGAGAVGVGAAPNTYTASEHGQAMMAMFAGRTRLTSRPLSDRNRSTFMAMLRQLSSKRFKIKEAMVFCLDHSDRAEEICEILSEALTLNETAYRKKMARLFLVSDVLCNCNTAKIKNASLYRSEFKNKHLHKIFASLHHLYTHDASNAKLVKENALKVIKVWENQCVFPSFFTVQLKHIFIHGEKQIHAHNAAKIKAAMNGKTSGEKSETMDEEKRSQMIQKQKEMNKHLVYPPHSKLFIAKKTNNPNKAFTASSFATRVDNNDVKPGLNKGAADDDEDEHKENAFLNLMKRQQKQQQNNVNMAGKQQKLTQQIDVMNNSTTNVGDFGFTVPVLPGQYDGEPLSADLCVDIDKL